MSDFPEATLSVGAVEDEHKGIIHRVLDAWFPGLRFSQRVRVESAHDFLAESRCCRNNATNIAWREGETAAPPRDVPNADERQGMATIDEQSTNLTSLPRGCGASVSEKRLILILADGEHGNVI
jgi:hypothetical protein